jgi:uncharacterized damage-inducible protein DinB
MGLAHHLGTMAYNNAWSNHRLLSACARLSDRDFVEKRTSFFPSIAATLNHNLTVDWYYIDALERSFEGREPNIGERSFWDPEIPFPRCADLLLAQRAADRRLIDFCTAMSDADCQRHIAVPRQTGVLYEPAVRLLSHLFEHQIHHRGQAHAMLAGTDVRPPQLDEFFCANEVDLRAAELAELGYSEAMIWG